MKSLNLVKVFAALVFVLFLAGSRAYAQPMDITVTFDSVTCQGASDAHAWVSAINNGTAPYTYKWFDGFGIRPETTDSIFGLPGGNYTCLVTDATLPVPQVATFDFEW